MIMSSTFNAKKERNFMSAQNINSLISEFDQEALAAKERLTKEMESRLRYINEHDKWTGLYNRDYLEALLNIEVKKKDGLKRAVISINLSTVQLLTANYGFG